MIMLMQTLAMHGTVLYSLSVLSHKVILIISSYLERVLRRDLLWWNLLINLVIINLARTSYTILLLKELLLLLLEEKHRVLSHHIRVILLI
jgi:hypothetical protein